jgi:hypothetical protein
MRDPNQREVIYKGKPVYSSFWPVFLLLVCVLAMMAYQLYWSWEQRQSLIRQIDLQSSAVAESQKVQKELEKLITDLLALAAKDADARAIINKNKITHTPEKTEGMPQFTPRSALRVNP